MALLGDVAKGITPLTAEQKKNKLTLRDFIDQEYTPWIMEHRKSWKRTLAHIKRNFFPPFGDKLIHEITPALVDQWRTQRLKDGCCTETVNRDIATFKAAISKAVLWGLADIHPLDRLKLLKSDRSVKVRFLSSSEETSLRTSP